MSHILEPWEKWQHALETAVKEEREACERIVVEVADTYSYSSMRDFTREVLRRLRERAK